MIYAHEFSQIKQHLNTIRTNVSRGKVYEIIEAIQKNQTAQVDEILKQVYRLIPSKDRDGVQHAIASLIAENVTRWYIVADLWDYIPES